MSRLVSLLVCVCLLLGTLTACGTAEPAVSSDGSAVPTDTTVSPVETSVPDTPAAFVFQPKICSVYLEEVFGNEMCDAWSALVDALLAGEETFACPDDETYRWVIGQFPERCWPVVGDLFFAAGDDPDHPVKDGVGTISYTVSREEFLERTDAFARHVESILNEAMRPGSTDFEKALDLYQYFQGHFTYDYDRYERMYQEYVSDIDTYHALTEFTSVCQGLSGAYSYLLNQAGVNATIVMGEEHQWSFVRIGGKDFHIDPTFVLSSPHSLSYFMMTDTQREATGFSPEAFIFTSAYAQEHTIPAFAATDDTFAPLWSGDFISLDRQAHQLTYLRYTDFGDQTRTTFDYSGW